MLNVKVVIHSIQSKLYLLNIKLTVIYSIKNKSYLLNVETRIIYSIQGKLYLLNVKVVAMERSFVLLKTMWFLIFLLHWCREIPSFPAIFSCSSYKSGNYHNGDLVLLIMWNLCLTADKKVSKIWTSNMYKRLFQELFGFEWHELTSDIHLIPILCLRLFQIRVPCNGHKRQPSYLCDLGDTIILEKFKSSRNLAVICKLCYHWQIHLWFLWILLIL